MIKIISQELKECENSDWSKTQVLEVFYKIWKDTWRFLLKDYNATNAKEQKALMKQIKEQITLDYSERLRLRKLPDNEWVYPNTI